MRGFVITVSVIAGLFSLNGLGQAWVGTVPASLSTLSCSAVRVAQDRAESMMSAFGLIAIVAAVVLFIACSNERFAHSKGLLILSGIAVLFAGIISLLGVVASGGMSCAALVSAASTDTGVSGLLAFLYFGGVCGATAIAAHRAR